MSFTINMKWEWPREIMGLIHKHFPDIIIYFQSENLAGDGDCFTNDEAGIYFPERYQLLYNDIVTEIESIDEYFTTLKDLAKRVEDITGITNLTPLESCNKAMDKFYSDYPDLCYRIYEFYVIEVVYWDDIILDD